MAGFLLSLIFTHHPIRLVNGIILVEVGYSKKCLWLGSILDFDLGLKKYNQSYILIKRKFRSLWDFVKTTVSITFSCEIDFEPNDRKTRIIRKHMANVITVH